MVAPLPKNLVSIRKAARETHKGRAYVRTLIRLKRVRAWISRYRVNGPELVVDLDELRRVIATDQGELPVYDPDADPREVLKARASGRGSGRRPSPRPTPSSKRFAGKPLNPDAAAI